MRRRAKVLDEGQVLLLDTGVNTDPASLESFGRVHVDELELTPAGVQCWSENTTTVYPLQHVLWYEESE